MFEVGVYFGVKISIEYKFLVKAHAAINLIFDRVLCEAREARRRKNAAEGGAKIFCIPHFGVGTQGLPMYDSLCQYSYFCMTFDWAFPKSIINGKMTQCDSGKSIDACNRFISLCSHPLREVIAKTLINYLRFKVPKCLMTSPMHNIFI